MYRRLLLILAMACSFARAQTLLTYLPQVYLDTAGNYTGYVTGFEHDSVSKKLYIAGQFVRVGNVKRNGFAVIDMVTGAVLPELDSLDFSKYNLANAVNVKLKLFNNRLYFGGRYQSNYATNYSLFSINLSNNNLRLLYNLAPLSDFEICNGKIYTAGARTSGFSAEYHLSEMDTLGNITWKDSISKNNGDGIRAIAIRNNILFIGGSFTSFAGVTCKNVAKVNLSTHTIQSWLPNPLPGPGISPSNFAVNDIAILQNDVLLEVGPLSSGNPSKAVLGYSIASGAVNNSIQQVPFSGDYPCLIAESDSAYWHYSSGNQAKLYNINSTPTTWAPATSALPIPMFRKAGYFFLGGGFTTVQGSPRKGLAVYCMAPPAPKKISTTTQACAGQGNMNFYISPVKDASSYSWVYTGTGVTVTGTSTVAVLNISNTATSGTIKVCGKSYCGTVGDTLYVPFTINPLPNANAGPDVTFTCSHNIDTLKGSSTTPGVSYSWWSGGFQIGSSAIKQITNIYQTGPYRLIVTNQTTGCKGRDTAWVFHDTARPAINHNLNHQNLSCTTHSVILNASPLYPTASQLHWSGQSFSQNNPATITNAGTYTLSITSGTNDCLNTDTFLVASNTTPPNITAPSVLDTITCARDSIQLSASSTAAAALIYWLSPNGDTIPNNGYTSFAGPYAAHVIDTTNGCTGGLFRNVTQYKTPPNLQLPSGNLNVNCSYTSLVLNGSSGTPGATLHWTGPGNFSSANPATSATPGYYILETINPQNGCSKKDSVQVTLQQILLVNGSADTVICNGSSATVKAAPVGGTAPFSYAWNTGGINSLETITATDTTKCIVTITDSTGCIGRDTMLVFVPAPVSDSTLTFQPCDPNNPNGEVQAFAYGGIPPYAYSLNGGTYQSTGIFSNLNFGTYTVTIHDTLGCSANFSAIIDSSSVLPAPDFILSTNQVQGDTFVLVDISNPRPDSVHWILPANCSIINQDPFNPVIVNADTGAFQITMLAWFGTCEMQLTKNIVVIPADTNIANNHNNNGISSLVLYPNPNSGQFTVDVDLYKKQSFAIFIFDAIGNEILRLPYSNSDHASANISMANPAPGTYVLKVIAEYDSRTKSFLISQH